MLKISTSKKGHPLTNYACKLGTGRIDSKQGLFFCKNIDKKSQNYTIFNIPKRTVQIFNSWCLKSVLLGATMSNVDYVFYIVQRWRHGLIHCMSSVLFLVKLMQGNTGRQSTKSTPKKHQFSSCFTPAKALYSRMIQFDTRQISGARLVLLVMPRRHTSVTKEFCFIFK